MGANDHLSQAANDVVHGVKEAAGNVSDMARSMAGKLLPGEHEEAPESPDAAATPSASAETDQLREIDPDPGNKAGVHDTAGDRFDHA